jgi:hypothetical protein
MRRTTIGALLAAGALLLAGCGSTGGTATAGTTVAATTAGSETMAPATPSSEETSAEAPTTEDSSSGELTTGGDSSSADVTTSDETTSEDSSTEAPTTTLGGDATGIDEQTTQWFDTFCTSLAPVKDLQNLQSQIDPSDPKKTLAAVSAAMKKLGTAFTDAGSKLKDAGKPTFEGGAEFADKIVSSFRELGPKFTSLAEKFAKADPSDPSSLSELGTLSSDLQDAVGPLQELQKIKVTQAVSQGIAAIPSCQALSG